MAALNKIVDDLVTKVFDNTLTAADFYRYYLVVTGLIAATASLEEQKLKSQLKLLRGRILQD